MLFFIVLLFQFRVILMPLGVSGGLFSDAFLQFLGQIDACLVGKADKYPQNIGHFLAQVRLFAWLKALVAVFACYHPSQFSHLFGEASHICKLREIAHAILSNPLIYSLLRLFYCHIPISLYLY